MEQENSLKLLARNAQSDKVEYDTMWIDECVLKKLKVSRGSGKNVVTNSEQITLNDGKGHKSEKYKGNKGWKRLVQEVGKRLPLFEKNKGMEIEYKCGKRNKMEGQRKENVWERTENQKKCRRVIGGSGLE